ncbi:MAG: NADH-quinone oxidoreductase subunit G [Propionibacteriaceae bacterium]
MTVTAKDLSVEQAVDQVTLTIDGIEVSVPKGTLVIRAAERLGIAIPRFCDHPLLDPVGACRECMVEVPDMGNGRGMPKPQASCTLEAMPGMKISTQLSSPVAAKAQSGMLEFLLINHPLDCPICDKGGECPLQNQAMSNGRGESRYGGVKRTFPKPVPISAQVLLDRERCVLCARCTRFSEQISGDPFIALVERGALQQVGVYAEQPYDSYFSGNVIQICPVGALTSSDYRFQARPFDLVSTTTSCEHCAAGCELRTDHRHYQVKRRMAGEAPEVNEEWNCDVGRFAFVSGRLTDRLTMPLLREDGVLRPASWPEAVDAAVAGLKAAGTEVGVLTGGRLTMEAAYAYQRFARTVLGTNNIDFRARVASAEEEQFLASTVAGVRLDDSVTYGDLERAGKVVLVGLEPEDECPIIFLRLRKAVRKRKLRVVAVAPRLSNGNAKLSATLVPTAPAGETAAIADLTDVDAGTVVLLGERLAGVPGALSAAVALAERTGARLAWVPRRAGEVGAVEAGCLPSLLPGGRLVSDGVARVDTGSAWGVASLPSGPGLDVNGMLGAASDETLKALVVAGAEIGDFADPVSARDAFEHVGFLVSIENRLSDIAVRADVVFPAALLEETTGTFLDWEHRPRPVARVNKELRSPMTDIRILAALADAMGSDLGVRNARQAAAELGELTGWDGARAEAPAFPGADDSITPDGLRLATWRELIDDSRRNDGADDLMETAPPPVARLSTATAARAGITDGEPVTVGTARGQLTYLALLDDTVVDGVVWIPSRAPGRNVAETLGARAGDPVTAKEGFQS